MSYYTVDDLISMGVCFGAAIRDRGTIKISRACNIYGVANLHLMGDNIRIDDFVVLSCCKGGTIEIGECVHISAHCYISAAQEGIKIGAYSAISCGCKLFGACDDFSGEYLVGPTVLAELTNVTTGCIYISSLVVVGANSVVLPGARLLCGAAIGACSLIREGEICQSFSIYCGTPLRYLKPRSERMYLLRLIVEEKNLM